jgi:hypothetical protein
VSEAERVRGLVAPFAEERDMYTKQIKAMLDEEKRRAQNHVSSQWIYGIHMAAARAYEKVLSIVELLEHRTRAMEQMYRDHLNTCVGGIFVRGAALAAEPTREQPSPELLQLLKDACDRDWKDETPEVIIRIACNALYWRDREIEKLKETDLYTAGRRDALEEAAKGQRQLLHMFVGYLSVEYGWEQKRWENCGKLADMFLGALAAKEGK